MNPQLMLEQGSGQASQGYGCAVSLQSLPALARQPNGLLPNPAVSCLLCRSRVVRVMGLLLYKFAECSPSPWVIHGRDIRLLWFVLPLPHIQLLRDFMTFFHLFQGIDVLVIDTAVCP